ncbi:WGxxGxxG family protein [Paenibacillus allorhizosphaerae]|uniref:MYXO-CTERM domain-containing protein n=1 Tax=Paenibacillus allorhizosphaerae TaxID=2849866 RepID=A0ABM8VS24_9BACL|nr:WGxxGxxG family protein [Paenibacillus allorhizosphaerae]CAG7655917.1 hypothetical protein PAECIP111802_06250 [Paenibacillus allorhizosphaerae]
MKACLTLLLALVFGMGAMPSAHAESTVDPTATNPTNADQVSFSKTIMSHPFERSLLSNQSGTAPLADPTGITGGRWGATGDEPAVYQAAAAKRSGWSWLGLLGLLGLFGLRKRLAK